MFCNCKENTRGIQDLEYRVHSLTKRLDKIGGEYSYLSFEDMMRHLIERLNIRAQYRSTTVVSDLDKKDESVKKD